MGCASSSSAAAARGGRGPVCARCHAPLGARLPNGRYVCHRCGGAATPLFPSSAPGLGSPVPGPAPGSLPQRAARFLDGNPPPPRPSSAPPGTRHSRPDPLASPLCPRCGAPRSVRGDNGEYRWHQCRPTPQGGTAGVSANVPGGGGGGSGSGVTVPGVVPVTVPGIAVAPPRAARSAPPVQTCGTCSRTIPSGLANCPYCGNLWHRIDAMAAGAPVPERPQSMPPPYQPSPSAPPLDEVSVSAPPQPIPGGGRDLALEDSDEALGRLASVLGADKRTMRKILRGLAAEEDDENERRGRPPSSRGGDGVGGRGEWSCPRCTFRNIAGAGRCEICEGPRPPLGNPDRGDARGGGGADRVGSEEAAERAAALEDAIESVSCPVCLEVYHSPMTFPCGHSLCLHHVPALRGRACPVCRAPYTRSQDRAARNAALCRNVRAVVLLASLEDPDRETVRDARDKMGIGDAEVDAADRLTVDAGRFREVAGGMSERFFRGRYDR